MNGLEFFAIEERKDNRAPYLWAPVHTDAHLGYFAIHGDLPVDCYRALKNHGLEERFFKSLANNAPRLWLTQAKHKNLVLEIQEKRSKGYQSYGGYTGTAYLLDLETEHGRRTPYSSAMDYLRVSLTEGYNRALFRPSLSNLVPALVANLELCPVWG